MTDERLDEIQNRHRVTKTTRVSDAVLAGVAKEAHGHRGELLDYVKELRAATPPIIGIIGRVVAAGYSFEYHADQDGPYELRSPDISSERVVFGETFEKLCVNILMNESLLNEVLK